MALIFTGGKAAPGYGDPGYWLEPAVALGSGVIAHWRGISCEINGLLGIGWSWSIGGLQNAHSLRLYGTQVMCGGTTLGDNILAPPASYNVWAVLRAHGAHWLLQGGGFAFPEMIYTRIEPTETGLYAGVSNYNAIARIEEVRIPKAAWLPVPLLSAGLVANADPIATTDGLGHVDTDGIGAGGSGAAWTVRAGVVRVSGAYGNAKTLGGGLAVATAESSKADVIATLRVHATGSGAAGMVLRYIDAGNYLYAVHDGTNARLVQRLAGVESTLLTGAAAFSADKPLVAILRGASCELFYNDVRIGAGATANAAFSTATAHGLYFTATDATVYDFVVWAKGTSGEYGPLAAL